MCLLHDFIGAIVTLHEQVSIVAADYCAISVITHGGSPVSAIGITAYDAYIAKYAWQISHGVGVMVTVPAVLVAVLVGVLVDVGVLVEVGVLVLVLVGVLVKVFSRRASARSAGLSVSGSVRWCIGRRVAGCFGHGRCGARTNNTRLALFVTALRSWCIEANDHLDARGVGREVIWKGPIEVCKPGWER